VIVGVNDDLSRISDAFYLYKEDLLKYLATVDTCTHKPVEGVDFLHDA
jgi:hypothetical protein